MPLRLPTLASLSLCTLGLAGCFLDSIHPIAPGRYYPAIELSQSGPENVTEYMDYWSEDHGQNTGHYYKHTELSAPGCVAYWVSGLWDIERATEGRILILDQGTLSPARDSTGCVPPEAPGRAGAENQRRYPIRRVSEQGFEICTYVPSNGYSPRSCPADSPYWQAWKRL